MFGMDSVTLDGKVIAKAVEQYLKDRLTPDACDFVVADVQQTASYRTDFKVTFSPAAPDQVSFVPEQPAIELSDI